MPVTSNRVRAAFRRHMRTGGFLEERTIESPAGSDGDFNAGVFEGSSISADNKAVIGELEVGSDHPAEDAVAIFFGHFIGGSRESNIAAQTRRARPLVDLETAADAEAASGAKVGFGSVKDSDEPIANAMSMTRESNLDANASGLNRNEIDPLTPEKAGFRWAGDGEHVVFIAGAPPNTSETYGLDHSEVEIPILVWDGREP